MFADSSFIVLSFPLLKDMSEILQEYYDRKSYIVGATEVRKKDAFKLGKDHRP